MVFVIALILGSIAFYVFFNAASMRNVAAEARALMTTASAVREYTVNQITPLLNQLGSAEFHPETVPSFAAQDVFKRISGSLSDYAYREVALNPTNTDDLAAPFEADLIAQFQADPSLTELSGARQVDDDRLFYLARPITLKDEGCLVCHSTPDVAPAAMIEKYGDENGFGWQLNDVAAVQLLSIPIEDEIRSTYELVAIFLAILVALFIFVSAAITLPLQRNIIQPLRELAKTAERSSLREDSTPLPQKGAREITTLAGAITRLRTSLHMSLNQTESKDE